ncbi:MAG: hypothetical protein V7761_12710, partial [Amylibacter sp.]
MPYFDQNPLQFINRQKQKYTTWGDKMYVIRFILDLIFFKNPVIVLVLSFITLYLAVFLNGQINAGKQEAMLAVKNGPPPLIRVEDSVEKQQKDDLGEINLLAEIDLSDKFKFTIVEDGVENTKFIVPLYTATEALPENTAVNASARALEHTDVNKRYDFNKSVEKRLIGAIVSDNETVFKKAQTLSDNYGQIGPIVKVNGQSALFDPEHEKLAQETLAKLGIEYGKYGVNQIYIKAFFGNRNAVLQKQINDNAFSNPIYPIAYVLLAIAYIRSLWHIISVARGSNDPSMVNAIINKFSRKLRNTEAPVSEQAAGQTERSNSEQAAGQTETSNSKR